MISISILEADLMCLAEEVDRSLLAGVDSIHIGYLDCSNDTAINFTLSISQSLRDYGVRMPISVLLNGSVTEELVKLLISSGVNCLYISPIAENVGGKILSLIKDSGCKSGLLINSEVSLYQYKSSFPMLDDVLIDLDTLQTDYSNTQAIVTIKNTKGFILNNGANVDIVVSGQLAESRIELLSEVGVESFIIGKLIFSSVDYYATVSKVKRQINLNKAP